MTKTKTATKTAGELRTDLMTLYARRAADALVGSGAKEPVVVIVRPKNDPLALSVVRQFSPREIDGVAVLVLERGEFLRHLGPFVAAEIGAAVRAGMPPSGAPYWLVCIAHGGATLGEGPSTGAA